MIADKEGIIEANRNRPLQACRVSQFGCNLVSHLEKAMLPNWCFYQLDISIHTWQLFIDIYFSEPKENSTC